MIGFQGIKVSSGELKCLADAIIKLMEGLP
jgi:hypothetical protein